MNTTYIQTDQDGFEFLLNKETKTAEVIKYKEFFYANEEDLSNVFIPLSITHKNEEFVIQSIKNNSFKAASINSIQFPPDSKILTIEKAFAFSTIHSISIPPSVTELKDGWCCNTPLLSKVTVMKNNKYYKNYEEDEKLILGKSDITKDEYDVLIFASRDIKKVTIPPNITTISSYAFSESSITHIHIPSHITQIFTGAFDRCTQLQQVDIPHDSKLQKIEKFVFENTLIENFIVPPQVTQICEHAFKDCQNLRNIEISSDSNLRIIDKCSFSGSSIENIMIPPSVTELKDEWCCHTPKLIKMTVMKNNQYYKNYEEDEKLILGKSDITKDEYDVLILASRDIKKVTIPPNITRISPYAFDECLIENIYIPSNITQICECAFYNCKGLHNIVISPCSKLQIIEAHSFSFSKIDELVIPPSVTELKDRWCCDTPFLSKVTVMKNNKYYKNYEEDEKLILGKSDITKDEYDVLIFASRNIKKVTIPPNITTISSYAFSESSITYIHIPSHITQIFTGAFDRCEKLQQVDIPHDSNLTKIEKCVFQLTSIKRIFIPDLITEIDVAAFFNCQKLKYVEFSPNSQLQTIQENAFHGSPIISISIPKHVIKINISFFGCSISPVRIVEINENTDMKKIDLVLFDCIYLMVPFNLRHLVTIS